MALKNILNKISEYGEALSLITSGRARAVALNGLSQVHKSHLCAFFYKNARKNILVVTPDAVSARALAADIEAFAGEEPLVFLSRSLLFEDALSRSFSDEYERIRTLSMAADGGSLIIADAPALMQPLPAPADFSRMCRSFRVGLEYDIDDIVNYLFEAGYEYADAVEGRGQYSRRGSIVDIFPPSLDMPVRLDFFDTELDSLSTFDPIGQRRVDEIKEAHITPAREVFLTESGRKSLEKKLTSLSRDADRAGNGELSSYLSDEAARLSSAVRSVSLDKYLPLICGASLFDYLGDAVVMVSEYKSVKDACSRYEAETAEDMTRAAGSRGVHKKLKDVLFGFWDVHAAMEKNPVVHMEALSHNSYDHPLERTFDVSASVIPAFKSEEGLSEDLKYYRRLGYAQIITVKDEEHARALIDRLYESEVIAAYEKTPAPSPGKIIVTSGTLSAGFIYKSAFLCVYVQSSASKPRRRARAPLSKDYDPKARLHSFTDLKEGDYVVHRNYGIGQFVGIERMEAHGVLKDYLKIIYAGSEVLYVQCDRLDMISKYIAPSGDKKVRLGKMSTAEFSKTKARVRAALETLADELIELYRARSTAKGHAFPPDSELDRDFDMKFEYEETRDQLRAIDDIKADMEKPVPMDRLLCGDVGFGKTEVALRAVFKCVLDGRQAAILVPTTILASQHYATVTKRFEGYPISCEVLSRFRTKKQQDESVARIADGRADIVIGTHRLLSQDIKFKDLGLLVVDEEQRFGVMHKERLKEIALGVDVLTLSATPIPRTLNMALSNVRDMSVIETPPSDRMPVTTYVIEEDERVVADAIRRELSRGGQVYYLHNRTDDIDSTAVRIGALVPEARVAVAHGRMTELALSRVMSDFIGGEADVLVCTTIIETGLDIPNVNTLIIENADRLGLAQLHQIRGRVGRSSRRAYAYFMYKRGKVVSEDAQKRLSAIREFTQFGAGFKLAMRDLEIRGAGNMLGVSQHGHIGNVGYEMYLRLLSEVIDERTGKKREPKPECTVELQTDAYIPGEYIGNSEQRIDAYKLIAAIDGFDASFDVCDELIDRFGQIPAPVLNLIDIALIRALGEKSGITEVAERDGLLIFTAPGFDMEAAGRLADKFGRDFILSAGKDGAYCFMVKIREKMSAAETALEVMKTLTGA
ncbi:MAG: transcription-repair coupling factor [Clostridia bacterium]|nr:transcription-repair coupling factor [Clostridia bacterium]